MFVFWEDIKTIISMFTSSYIFGGINISTFGTFTI